MTYIYKEYPRTLHKPNAQVCTVRDDDEKAAALEAGWSLLPVMDAQDDLGTAAPPAADEAPAEAEPVEDDAPKKRGRKARG